MSNVRIENTGDEILSVEVLLGTANRAWHSIAPGDSVDLAVGGNQKLLIGPAREEPTAFVTPDDEPAVETAFVEGQDEMPLGVDVLSKDKVDGLCGPAEVAGTDPVADQTELEGYREVAGAENGDPAKDEVEPVEDAANYSLPYDDAEEVKIGAEDVGDLGTLFANSEVAAETEIVKDLGADSPLETGSIADLPNPFDEGEIDMKPEPKVEGEEEA